MIIYKQAPGNALKVYWLEHIVVFFPDILLKENHSVSMLTFLYGDLPVVAAYCEDSKKLSIKKCLSDFYVVFTTPEKIAGFFRFVCQSCATFPIQKYSRLRSSRYHFTPGK